ncbi:MAG: hypothetical protein ACFFAO_12055 [Candidatus Hermodarchaeota archaeon]
MTIDDNYVFPVYIIDNVLNKINEICALHELEVFGYLVGDIFNWKHQKYVVISNQIYVEGQNIQKSGKVSQNASQSVYKEVFQFL